MSAPLLTSCFTGVESTKKITLSKEDVKSLKLTEEEKFFESVSGQPLSEWKPGKLFAAADDRTALIFEREGLPVDPVSLNIGGKHLSFTGTGTRISPDGSNVVILKFECQGQPYFYNTGKSQDEAPLTVTSDAIPMLIDLDMVERAKELLAGKKLWTRTPLWYDSLGNRIPGKKYVPVTVREVVPGTQIFPIKVAFEDDADKTGAWVFMNFGHGGKDSRSFANLFYLSDIRRKYPAIEDEVWQLICNEKVKTGMTKEECRLALGTPTDVDSGRDYSHAIDLWNYNNGTMLWFEDGILTRFRR